MGLKRVTLALYIFIQVFYLRNVIGCYTDYGLEKECGRKWLGFFQGLCGVSVNMGCEKHNTDARIILPRL
jgi:hypothetical protein